MRHSRGVSDKLLIRKRIAKRAAEMLCFNGISDYYVAKNMAAKEFYLGKDLLPSNDEIKGELDILVQMSQSECESMDEYMDTIYNVALDVMLHMYKFSPILKNKLDWCQISSDANVEILVFNDSSSDAIFHFEEIYDAEVFLADKVQSCIIQKGIKINLSIYVCPISERGKYLSSNFLNIYQLAKKNQRLDDLHEKEEQINECEICDDEDCFLFL